MKLEAILPRVRKPGRYCGNEFNVVRKSWSEAAVRVALVFPDLYEIGMSHQGLQILYHILNRHPRYLAERAYAPDVDLEELLRRYGLPLFSLESRRPLAEFDMLGITLPYELCYTNILTVLELAGLPWRAAERSAGHPLVVGGGPCAFHPEPVAAFFDAIVLGDGEEAVVEVAACLEEAKAAGLPRSRLLERLAGIEGVYVPSLFRARYDAAGVFHGMEPLLPGYQAVRRRLLPDLNQAEPVRAPLVPASRIVHDRLGVEIARGCTRGCRFCQAGIIYRPVRERSPDQVFSLAEEGVARGGFEELALLSLSSGDYGCIGELLMALMNRFAEERVSVSLPSMRVGTLTPEIMAQIKRVRKTGFTLAPEAGTDRLRRVLNKGISEADLLAATEAAYGLGWRLIKLYFMFGLPTEERVDLEAIPALARKVLRTAAGKGQVTVSVATFVPKPHTPFQWEPQLSVEQSFERIDFLKSRLAGKGLRLKWHDPRQSFLEGVFSRGDRRLTALIEEAWRDGARLDAWSDHFDLGRWQEAARRCGIDLDNYLRRRDQRAPLPWDHLEVGVDEEFLRAELTRAHEEAYTPDCRVNGCQQCGLCDFQTIRPVVFRPEKGCFRQPPVAAGGQPALPDRQPGRFIYRCTYSRTGEARLLSHLELIQVFFRAFRRACLPLAFSQGFNPTPRVSFGPALPVGTESLAEQLWLELTRPLPDPAGWQVKLNEQLPAGLRLTSLELGKKPQAKAMLICYHIRLGKNIDDPGRLQRLLAADRHEIPVRRKGKMRRIDVRPQVISLRLLAGDCLELELIHQPGRAGVKPMELLAALLELDEEQVAAARVTKIWTREHDPDKRGGVVAAAPGG